MKTMLFALALAALVLCAARSRAEDWRVLSDVNLTLTQNAYSDNWAGGESGSMSWTLNSNTIAEKQILKGVFNKNTLKLSYGLTYNQDTETNTWDSGNKSTDLIDLESTFRWTLGTFVEPIIAFRGITQFVDQSEDAIDDALLPANASKKDRLFNPLDLTESVGVARVFVKEETREWQARLGVAAKQIV
ncbi:MAG: DUF3078 domain-containing protein, partial [Candidatus Krumholzibacteria bacterium]|nr:DUF3078 domain-containing protein [Candidatus Krumholzibacteria bacterium]